MIIERVEFEIKPGQMEAFLAHCRDSGHVFRNSQGCRSFSYGRGVENPDKAIFILRWDSVAAHEAARGNFDAFREPMPGFVAGVVVEHFDMSEWAGA
jgi:quinol monooxygenase YgiN